MSLASKADLHASYEAVLNTPEQDVIIIELLYSLHKGRPPLHLREDFSGTCVVSKHFVLGGEDRTARCVDIDLDTIEWGFKRHIAPLPREVSSRLRLECSDVLNVTPDGKAAGKVVHPGSESTQPWVAPDVVVANNFSYLTFSDWDRIVNYFTLVREGLADDGVFILDLYGGEDARGVTVEDLDTFTVPMKKLLKEEHLAEGSCDDNLLNQSTDITYVYEQESYNPETRDTVVHVSFRYEDDSVWARAFTYRWKLWSWQEIRDGLKAAGFRSVHMYPDSYGEDGRYKHSTEEVEVLDDSEDYWSVYFVAVK